MRGPLHRATHRRRLLAMLLALTTVTAACSAAVGAALTSPSAAGLTRFDGCDALAGELHRRALPHVTSYGIATLDGFAVAADAAAEAGAAPAQPARSSTTNVQVADVDEPDVVKTDGHYLYALAASVLRVVDVRGVRPSVTATLRLDGGVPRDLLLHGTRLLVLGDDGPVPLTEPPRDGGVLPLPPVGPHSRLWAVDVGDPARPVVTSTLVVEGAVLTARLIDGTARVVLRSTPVPAGLVVPSSDAADADRAVALNRRRIALATADDWLPMVAVDAGPSRPLVQCAAVHHVAGGVGTGVVSVLSLELDRDDFAVDRVTAVLGAADTVYADRDSLYVTTSRWPQPLPVEPPAPEPLPVEPPAPAPLDPLPLEPRAPQPLPLEPRAPQPLPLEPRAGQPLPLEPRAAQPLPGPPDAAGAADASRAVAPPASEVTTEVHRFDLIAGGGADYVASGTVPGTVLNQWALSEHDDDLRIATTIDGDGTDRSSSAVHVLRREGDRLVEVGRIGDLGRGERIYAVRYAGDLGFVVTFRQIDPLYTFDLSAPTAPRVLGELKVPGYSAYLHPIGDEHLLGIGQDADGNGRVNGVQVSLFDVGDLRAPTRVGQVTLGPHTSSPVEYDHRAVLSWPARGLVIVPVERWDTGDVRMLVVEARGDGTLRERGTIVLPDGQGHGVGPVRNVIVGDRLLTVTPGAVVTSDLSTLRRLAVRTL